MSGRRRSSTTQSNGFGRDRFERFAAGIDDGDVDIVVAQQVANAQLLAGIVLDDQQPLAARRRVFLDARQRRIQPFGRGRLGDEGKCAARQAVVAVFIESEHLDRNMPGGGILLEMVEHRPSQHVGQEYIEGDGGGWNSRASARASDPRVATRTLKPLSREDRSSTRA